MPHPKLRRLLAFPSRRVSAHELDDLLVLKAHRLVTGNPHRATRLVSFQVAGVHSGIQPLRGHAPFSSEKADVEPIVFHVSEPDVVAQAISRRLHSLHDIHPTGQLNRLWGCGRRATQQHVLSAPSTPSLAPARHACAAPHHMYPFNQTQAIEKLVDSRGQVGDF